MFKAPKKLALAAVIGVSSIFSGAAAEASLIGPNQSAPPDVFSYNIAPGDVLGTISNPFSATSGSSTIQGTYTTEVVRDPTRGGLLNFLIQVTENAGSTLHRITDNAFGGFLTDVGYL